MVDDDDEEREDTPPSASPGGGTTGLPVRSNSAYYSLTRTEDNTDVIFSTQVVLMKTL